MTKEQLEHGYLSTGLTYEHEHEHARKGWATVIPDGDQKLQKIVKKFKLPTYSTLHCDAMRHESIMYVQSKRYQYQRIVETN